MCVIAHKNNREDFGQLHGLVSICLNDMFWQKLQAAKADLTEQAFSSVKRDVYEILIVGI